MRRLPAWLLVLLVVLAALAPLGLLAALSATPGAGAEASPRLQEAVDAYGQGRYGKAADLYRRAAEAGADSAGLWQGLGCALFQLGDMPRARAAFEKARLRAPRSGDLRHDLDLVRQRLKADDDREGALVRAAGLFTPGELAAAWSLLSFLGILLGALGLHRGVSALKTAALVLLVLALPFGLLLGLRAVAERSGAKAVVVAPDLRLRAGPGREYEEAGPAAAGSVVRVQEQSGHWRRIITGGGFEGWLRAEQLDPLTREE